MVEVVWRITRWSRLHTCSQLRLQAVLYFPRAYPAPAIHGVLHTTSIALEQKTFEAISPEGAGPYVMQFLAVSVELLLIVAHAERWSAIG